MLIFRNLLCTLHARRLKTLTTNETSIALRPFLFAVHPDLFGKFPKEQAVNESSLKLLNEHITKLQNEQPTNPLHLTFHLRNPNNSKYTGDFKIIKLRLDSQDVSDVVKKVLSACNLPLDYLNATRLSANVVEERTKSAEEFGDNWKTYSGFEKEYFHKRYKMDHRQKTHVSRSEMENSLNVWIERNRAKVMTQMRLAQPIKAEIAFMKNKLKSRYQLKDIIWLNSWTLASFRTSLRGLMTVMNSMENETLNLKDHIITFSNDIGVSVNGHIVLQRDIVSNSWTTMLRTLDEELLILSTLPKYESKLSELLGGCVVFRPTRSVVLADAYLSRIKQLIDDVIDFKMKDPELAIIDEDISDVQLSVECTTGSLMISQSGIILIPSHCPTFLLFDFIRKKVNDVRKIRLAYAATKLASVDMLAEVQEQLGLLSLSQDAGVNQEEMLTCCSRLLNLRKQGLLKADLTGISLYIAQHYSVMLDGEMAIPWNFKI